MIQTVSLPSTVPPHVLPFPSVLKESNEGTTLDANSCLSLRSYYVSEVLPEIKTEQRPNSLKEDRIALNHWERILGDIDIRNVKRETIQEFRDGLISTPMADATANKIWRELKSIFEVAFDENVIEKVPTVGRKMRSKLIRREKKQRQREIITANEVNELWLPCRHAAYPVAHRQLPPAAKLWRVAMVLFWTYGPRTLDVFRLRWDDVQFSSGLIKFEAMKTGKLQGLPMTELVRKHLRSIYRPNAKHVFPGFNSRGCFLRATGKWKTGYYTTWKRDIVGNSKLKTMIVFKNFRQRVVSEYNSEYDGIKLGSWIAGHSMQGVSAINYELPTREIREAIEAAPVPDCFHEIG